MGGSQPDRPDVIHRLLIPLRLGGNHDKVDRNEERLCLNSRYLRSVGEQLLQGVVSG